ncbi:tripartite tricarboxylate transporter TctB family protein [Halalkalicoccus subterraneus]|uniref:tripartite tricarboxylate transporter TctB family protein n=1 Tax=Halalkalicoccus subterraneus TaxID=2675002 RepID=UPI001FE6024A|nr:tripartite tricarboxylate transporter TctB family protein [Halalkalicoccus subterraneus]
MSIKNKREQVTAEHVMLVALLALSAVFLIEPIVSDYPDDARVFPQLMASVVLVGSLLLLVRNYLPEPLYTVVGESINITTSDTASEAEEELSEREKEIEAETEPKQTLAREYGYDVNDTVFMMAAATLYFFAGWAAGFLFVTPLFVYGYTTWFRVRPAIGIGLAVLSTVIVYLFIEFLILPLDQGAIFDFSPFLPVAFDPVPFVIGVL